MPNTKLQSIVFTAMMVFFMVFCMTTYNLSLKMGELSYFSIGLAIKEMWIEYVIVFCIIFFVISKTAQKLAFRIVTPNADKPIFIILVIQSFTVCLTVPAITLIATFIYNGFTTKWFTQWIQQAFLCFPTALCLQIFFIGPLVRFIFKLIFSKQLADETTE